MSIEAKTKAVELYIRVLNEHSDQLLKELYANDATVEDPYGTEPHVGIEAIMAFYQGAFEAKISAELTGPIRVAGDSAAFSFNVIFQGMRIEVIDVFVFNEQNQVTSMRAYWSEANMSPVA